MTYYNTTNETGSDLARYRAKAGSQEEQILDWFEKHPTSSAAPSYFTRKIAAPITSIRRAMTDLTKSGALQMTNVKIVGPWGRSEHTWRLSVPGEPQGDLFEDD